MEYNFTYGVRCPGLIYILCDLSEKMKIAEEQLQVAVKSILVDYLNGCVSGQIIKKRLFITLIGYGNDSPHIIQQGWVDEWKNTVVNAHIKNEKIIKEQLNGMCESESVWGLVRNEIKEALDCFLHDESFWGLGSPHIINITNRKPSNEKGCEDYINEIKSLKDSCCGKIPDIMISTILLLDKYENVSDKIFINREKTYRSRKVEFWKSVVSEVPIDVLKARGIDLEEESVPVSCCMIHNAKHSASCAWATFGS